MNKQEIADRLNLIFAQARKDAHKLLDDEKYEFGNINEYWSLTLPDTGKFKLGNAGMKVRTRCINLGKAVEEFISMGYPISPDMLVSEEEIKEYADKMTKKNKRFDEIKNTDEYKEYLRLFNKFKDYINS